MQRQSDVAAEKSRLMLIVQPDLKNIVCILHGGVFAPRLQTLLVHADDNLIGRFTLGQRLHHLLQGKRQRLRGPHHFNAHELTVCPG